MATSNLRAFGSALIDVTKIVVTSKAKSPASTVVTLETSSGVTHSIRIDGDDEKAFQEWAKAHNRA